MRRMGLSYQMERYVCIASNQWILKVSLTDSKNALHRQIPICRIDEVSIAVILLLGLLMGWIFSRLKLTAPFGAICVDNLYKKLLEKS